MTLGTRECELTVLDSADYREHREWSESDALSEDGRHVLMLRFPEIVAPIGFRVVGA